MLEKFVGFFNPTERYGRELRKTAGKAASTLSTLPFVENVVLFGSVATGKPTKCSDVDLCVVVSDDTRTDRARLVIVRELKEKHLHRIRGSRLEIDLFIYNKKEFQKPPSERDTMSNADELRLGKEIEAGEVLFDRTQNSDYTIG